MARDLISLSRQVVLNTDSLPTQGDVSVSERWEIIGSHYQQETHSLIFKGEETDAQRGASLADVLP